MRKFAIITALVSLFLILAPVRSYAAGTWEYYINSTDTPTTIDNSVTTAYVDTINNEITLSKKAVPNVISFWPDGELAYAVLKNSGVAIYMFDGSQMVENTTLSINTGENPLALATLDTLPDFTVATSTELQSYVFNGSGMVRNPALETAGLANALSLGTRENDIAGLVNGQYKHYSFTGSGLAENTILEPGVPLTNLLQIALVPDNYDVAVLEKDKVRYFNFSGSDLIENPALSVTGLVNPKAFCVKETGEISVVEGTEVKHYQFDGSSMTYNSVLSISGLTNPTAVAFRPGTWDRVVVDGNQLKYYAFDGSNMVEVPQLSVTVNDIVKGNTYNLQDVAQSQSYNPGLTDRVRVRARHDLPANTTVTWFVTADGTNWTESWRVRNDGVNTYCEVYDSGAWVQVSDASAALPENNTQELWVQVNPGNNVKWRAVLETTDNTVTPKIIGGAQVAVVLESDHTPNAPVINPPPAGCYATSTPTFTWMFSDNDLGDTQSAYQVQVRRKSDGALIYDSGKVMSSNNSFTLPGSTRPDQPSALWSSGEYQYTFQVRTWDSYDQVGNWSAPVDFCVIALERLRVSEIVSPPPGQVAPDPADPSTHIMIFNNMPVDQLPKVKAGAKVQILVDSIGPVDSLTSKFPYLTYEATVADGTPSNINPLGSEVNRWLIEFWTSADKKEVPDGTIVQCNLSGTTAFGTARLKTTAPYEVNLVKIEGSVYEDWMVVIQGRNRP